MFRWGAFLTFSVLRWSKRIVSCLFPFRVWILRGRHVCGLSDICSLRGISIILFTVLRNANGSDRVFNCLVYILFVRYEFGKSYYFFLFLSFPDIHLSPMLASGEIVGPSSFPRTASALIPTTIMTWLMSSLRKMFPCHWSWGVSGSDVLVLNTSFSRTRYQM